MAISYISISDLLPLNETMSEVLSDNVNDLPFKLRFTSTQKLCKEITKLIADRYDILDKLTTEYETIGQHKHILGNIKSELQTCNDSLKQLRSLCQCQSDDDKIAINKQLANSEELLTKLETKCATIQTVKCVDVEVKRLPSNWRAAMLKIARDKAKKAFNESVGAGDHENKANDISDNDKDMNENNDNENNKEENKSDDNNDENQMNENMISSSAAEMNHQFEIDLERKIYETQVEELMLMVQTLIMKIKTMRARIDISKQLIKVVLKMKREYESANSKLKESLATCHCAEAGTDEDLEFQKRMEEKKRLEETVDRISSDLKYWEEQYAILKEPKKPINETPNDVKPEMSHPTQTTVIEVANEQEIQHEMMPIASTSSQQSCMFAGQSHSGQHSGGHSQHTQGTANPAVIYLEGLVAHQQPTYIPAANLHQPLGVYPHSYSLGHHPHHPYHQAPDGSIQVYSSDIASHPGYIAYQ